MPTTKRPSFQDFKAKALQNVEVKIEYDALAPYFALKKRLADARLEKGVTQEQIAQKIGTSKSNISRLESLNNTYMPNLATLYRYANALDMKLDIALK